jgi:hypothetical protein
MTPGELEELAEQLDALPHTLGALIVDKEAVVVHASGELSSNDGDAAATAAVAILVRRIMWAVREALERSRRGGEKLRRVTVTFDECRYALTVAGGEDGGADSGEGGQYIAVVKMQPDEEDAGDDNDSNVGTGVVGDAAAAVDALAV